MRDLIKLAEQLTEADRSHHIQRPFHNFVHQKALEMAGKVFDMASECIAEARQKNILPSEYDPGSTAGMGIDAPDEADFIEAMMGILASQRFNVDDRFKSE
jgi:hypothetical protein